MTRETARATFPGVAAKFSQVTSDAKAKPHGQKQARVHEGKTNRRKQWGGGGGDGPSNVDRKLEDMGFSSDKSQVQRYVDAAKR